ncbi:MAG: hypothetical protein K6G48_00495 [Acholeplasmatales bacterium]|nr:hypothetical protein [Acholeplasmatales bacterium]
MSEITYDNYKEFEISKNNELKTSNVQNVSVMESYESNVGYISDIHLQSRYKNNGCTTIDDIMNVNHIISENIYKNPIKIALITGDISNNYYHYEYFIRSLLQAKKTKNTICDMFVTLGNHELWPFSDLTLDQIVNKYNLLLSCNGIHLVHNNLYFYQEYRFHEITYNNLKTYSVATIRNKLKNAQLIIFGGIGFSGRNPIFNANKGIYQNVITRDEEILESEKIDFLYQKVKQALYDKNVIIMTHMPLQDWSNDKEPFDRFYYVSGHNHNNFILNKDNKHYFSDNQIGYYGKNIYLKYFYINDTSDFFSEYKDGIYEISKMEYLMFYNGKSLRINFNRPFKKIYMIKKMGAYMFMVKRNNDNILLLNGGRMKKIGQHSLEYFYENLDKYVKSVNDYLKKYADYLKTISKEVSKIGGHGRIHGSIVDIDELNHLYVNPLDGTITPYYANSMKDKYVYDNFESLLFNKLPSIYNNLNNYLDANRNQSSVILKNEIITNHRELVEDTSIYKISGIIKSLQYTTENRIVRLWNDKLLNDDLTDTAKYILSDILAYELEEK